MTLMPQRWMTCFAAVVLVASLACGAAPGAEDDPVSSNSTGYLTVEELLEQAEQGHADAQHFLGLVYANGEGMPEDFGEAMLWFRQAAEQGHAVAQTTLGAMYADGRGVRQDHVEAVRWWRLAAEQGEARAQDRLGSMYYEGRGVVQDYVQAHMWRNLAASQQTTEERKRSVEARDALADLMTPAQLAEAQRLAREWDEAHPRD